MATALNAPVAAPQPVAYAAPPIMTQGIPDPASIEKQRAEFEVSLQRQYADGAAAIKSELALRQKMLGEQAHAQREQFTLQAQSQAQAQYLRLDQQMNSKLMMLQESAMAQRSALEQ